MTIGIKRTLQQKNRRTRNLDTQKIKAADNLKNTKKTEKTNTGNIK